MAMNGLPPMPGQVPRPPTGFDPATSNGRETVAPGSAAGPKMGVLDQITQSMFPQPPQGPQALPPQAQGNAYGLYRQQGAPIPQGPQGPQNPMESLMLDREMQNRNRAMGGGY